MLTDLENGLNDKSIYHIIKFESAYLNSDEIFFLLDINKYGFIKVDIFFPDELNIKMVLPKVQQIHYHVVDLFESTTYVITEKVRIKVIFSDFTEEIILEADEQCWYVSVENTYCKNRYYQGQMRLLLFMRMSPSLHNGSWNQTIYPPFYAAQFRYFDHVRMQRYRSNIESEEEKKYQEWERIEYRKLADRYFHLFHFSHPKRFEYSADKFKKWKENEETDYLKKRESIDEVIQH